MQRFTFAPRLHLWALLAVSFGSPHFQAEGQVVIKAREVGDDVVFRYSGSLDTIGFTDITDFLTFSINPGNPALLFGPVGSNFVAENAIAGPGSIGSGDHTPGSSAAGDVFGLCESCGRALLLPDGYVSGTPILGSTTFNSATFASLGINDAGGPYVWTLTNVKAETITLRFPDTERKRIKKLRKAIKKARRKNQIAKAKRLTRKLKRFQRRLRAL